MNVIWRKIGRDLFHNKTRSLTVIFSIAIGLFALGTVFNLSAFMRQQMADAWQSARISNIHAPVYTAVDNETLAAVAAIPGVSEIEEVMVAPARWKLPGDEAWRSGLIFARADFRAQTMDLINLREGRWPIHDEVVVEYQTGQYFNLQLETQVFIKAAEDEEQLLPVVGAARSIQAFTPQLGGDAVFYAAPDTVAQLSGLTSPNLLNVRLSHFSEAEAAETARQVREILGERGVAVGNVEITDPAVHERQGQIQALWLVLGVLGAALLALSAFLVINVFQAIMIQQTKQIGIMKAIGASVWQVTVIYLLTALFYGFLAVMIAIPTSAIAALYLGRFLLSLANIEAVGMSLAPTAVGVQLAAGLLTPALAALAPTLRGAGITVRQAIQTYGLQSGFGENRWEVWLTRIQGLPVSLNLALRNAIRRRGRLLVTLLMLVMGGLIFISVMSVQSSLQTTVQGMVARYEYGVQVDFEIPQAIEEVEAAAHTTPGVAHAEVWQANRATLAFNDGEGRALQLFALPPESQIYHPQLVDGRWLDSNDERVIVLNAMVAQEEDVQVGDTITIPSLDDGAAEWRIIGLVFDISNRQRTAFVPRDVYLTDLNQTMRGNLLLLQPAQSGEAAQLALEEQIRDHLTAANIPISNTTTTSQILEMQAAQMGILSALLLAMSVLAAVVGGLGLMGAISINVTERLREIGVMRAIGASSWSVAGVFIGEGIVAGLISWFFAAILSYPAGLLFSQALGQTLFGIPLDYAYSLRGLIFWLLMVMLLAFLSSVWPAWRASRLRVQQSLAYE